MAVRKHLSPALVLASAAAAALVLLSLAAHTLPVVLESSGKPGTAQKLLADFGVLVTAQEPRLEWRAQLERPARLSHSRVQATAWRLFSRVGAWEPARLEALRLQLEAAGDGERWSLRPLYEQPGVMTLRDGIGEPGAEGNEAGHSWMSLRAVPLLPGDQLIFDSAKIPPGSSLRFALLAVPAHRRDGVLPLRVGASAAIPLKLEPGLVDLPWNQAREAKGELLLEWPSTAPGVLAFLGIVSPDKPGPGETGTLLVTIDELSLDPKAPVLPRTTAALTERYGAERVASFDRVHATSDDPLVAQLSLFTSRDALDTGLEWSRAFPGPSSLSVPDPVEALFHAQTRQTLFRMRLGPALPCEDLACMVPAEPAQRLGLSRFDAFLESGRLPARGFAPNALTLLHPTSGRFQHLALELPARDFAPSWNGFADGHSSALPQLLLGGLLRLIPESQAQPQTSLAQPGLSQRWRADEKHARIDRALASFVAGLGEERPDVYLVALQLRRTGTDGGPLADFAGHMLVASTADARPLAQEVAKVVSPDTPDPAAATAVLMQNDLLFGMLQARRFDPSGRFGSLRVRDFARETFTFRDRRGRQVTLTPDGIVTETPHAFPALHNGTLLVPRELSFHAALARIPRLARRYRDQQAERPHQTLHLVFRPALRRQRIEAVLRGGRRFLLCASSDPAALSPPEDGASGVRFLHEPQDGNDDRPLFLSCLLDAAQRKGNTIQTPLGISLRLDHQPMSPARIGLGPFAQPAGPDTAASERPQELSFDAQALKNQFLSFDTPLLSWISGYEAHLWLSVQPGLPFEARSFLAAQDPAPMAGTAPAGLN